MKFLLNQTDYTEYAVSGRLKCQPADYGNCNTIFTFPHKSDKEKFYVTRDGNEIEIEKYSELVSELSTSAKALLKYAILHIQHTNFLHINARSITPTAIVPIGEYGVNTGRLKNAARKSEKKKQETENTRYLNELEQFKKDIRIELQEILNLKWTVKIIKGRAHGTCSEMRLIDGYSIKHGDVLLINFNVGAAVYLINSYILDSDDSIFD